MSMYSLSRILLTSLAGRGEELAGTVAAAGVTGAAGEVRFARDDATETTDGTEMGGRPSASENVGIVAIIEVGGNMPRPASINPRTTMINCYCPYCLHTCLHAP